MLRSVFAWGFMLAAIVAVLGPAAGYAAEEKKPADELSGVWRLIIANEQMHMEADSPDRSTLLTYDGEAKTWRLQPRSDADGQFFVGTYFVDATQTPKLLDATIQGDGGNTDIYAIYKIEDDVLTIHFRNDGRRPADFDTPVDQGSKLVLKRHDPNK